MTILFTVTNDLTYDQRMHRICGTLASAGHRVTLVGRALPRSVPLEERVFYQKRLRCFFNKGFAFYAEYNLRLFFFLLAATCDAVCSIDLDTLPAGCLATLLRRKKRVFDAHEYFTEVPEVVDRPFVKGFWETVARLCLPFYRHAYTVGPRLAEIFEQKYGVNFGVVRNAGLTPGPSPEERGARHAGAVRAETPLSLGEGPELRNAGLAPGTSPEERGARRADAVRAETPLSLGEGPELRNAGLAPDPSPEERGARHAGVVRAETPLSLGEGPGVRLLYAGALNEGRGLETALKAMQSLDNVQLWLAGEGDLSARLRDLTAELGVENRVTFLGYTRPDDLRALVPRAWLGLNLLENRGLSYYYSLANKFFACVQACVPVLTMDFPEYRALNEQHEVAVLLDELTPEKVVGAVNKLLTNKDLYEKLRQNCFAAREEWNWEKEEKALLDIWKKVFI